MTFVVGVTGGVGSGKSEFAAELGRLGARVIDADDIGRRLADENSDVREGIRGVFGPDVFGPDGALLRRELGRLVFADADALDRLNRVIRPFLIETIEKRLSAFRERGVRWVVVDMAILFEAGMERLLDEVIVVTAPQENRIERLQASRGWSREEVEDRMRSQWTEDRMTARADTIILNDGTIEDLRHEAGEWFAERSMDHPQLS